jgi:glycosyltransferase involved in cell wall biosynthesis
MSMPSQYDKYHYLTTSETTYGPNDKWKSFFGKVADVIVREINPKTVLDAGCAYGYLVAALRDRGVEAYGIDASQEAIDQVREDIKPFCKVGSMVAPLNKDYDLIVCVEVIEHLHPHESNAAIENLCRFTNDLIFSSTPFDFKEATHFNVQPTDYWAKIFSAAGFYRDVNFDASFIVDHAIRFKKNSDTNAIADYERGYFQKEQENKQLREELIIAKAQMSQKYNEAINGQTPTSADTSSQVRQLTLLLNEKDNSLQHINNELELLNELFQAKKAEYTRQIKSIQNQLAHKDSTIARLTSEANAVRNENNSLQHGYHSSATELNRIHNLKGVKLLWKYYKFRELISKGPVKQQPNAPVKKTVEPVIKSEELILDLEHAYYSKNPIYNVQFDYEPVISIIVPVYNTPIDLLEEMIASVLNQTYTHFELCIVNATPNNRAISQRLKEFRRKDNRVVITNIENAGIAENTNAGIRAAKGEFIAFLDHDDILAPHALFEVVSRLQDDRLAHDFFYSDKDMMPEEGTSTCNPLYKPKWSPEIMYSANYPTHFCVVRRTLLDKSGLLTKETDGAQDWDIYLKFSRLTDKICHIPQKLYHWRIIQTSVASGIGAKPYALAAQVKSITDHLNAINYKATIDFQDKDKSILQLTWDDSAVTKVTFLLIDNSDDGYLEELFETLKEYKKKSGRAIEIMVLTEPGSATNLQNFQQNITATHHKTGNLYADLNTMIKNSTGEVLVCLDSKATFADAESIQELVSWAIQEQYGFISPKILNRKNGILSTGFVINGNFLLDMFQGVANKGYTIFGNTEWYRNITAARTECFAIKTSLLKNTPFNSEFEVYAGIESALHLSNKGLRHVYTPFATIEISELDEFHATNLNKPAFKKLKADYNIEQCDRHWNENLEYHNSIPTENRRKVITLTKPKQPKHLVTTGWENYNSEAMDLASTYDFSTEDITNNFRLLQANNGSLNIKSVNWFLPDFDFIYYAGLYTIFRFANYMQSEKGVKNNFIIVGRPNTAETHKMIVEAFPNLYNSGVYAINSFSNIETLPYADAGICTLWTTAYYLLRFNNTKRKFYFIQDYEPLFYPAGSTYGQSETTYKFGFYGLTNTMGLRKIYERDYNGQAMDLKPCVDDNIFYPRKANQRPNDNKFRVFFYGRPGHPRNGFELGAAVLRKLKEKLEDKVEIYCAGSEWNPENYNLEGVVTNLGRIDFEKTGDLYRLCDVGLVMMFTKHPSYLPFELMACKCAVVTNYNPDTTWFLKNEENCILTDASATRIAEAIEKLLLNEKLRNRLTETAWNDISQNHAWWDDELNKLYNFMGTPKG